MKKTWKKGKNIKFRQNGGPSPPSLPPSLPPSGWLAHSLPPLPSDVINSDGNFIRIYRHFRSNSSFSRFSKKWTLFKLFPAIYFNFSIFKLMQFFCELCRFNSVIGFCNLNCYIVPGCFRDISIQFNSIQLRPRKWTWSEFTVSNSQVFPTVIIYVIGFHNLNGSRLHNLTGRCQTATGIRRRW